MNEQLPNNQPANLKSIKQLFTESWQILTRIFLRMGAIYVVPLLCVLALLILILLFIVFSSVFTIGIVNSGVGGVVMGIIFAIFGITIIILGIMSAPALIYIIRERDNMSLPWWQQVKDAYKFAWSKLLSFIWIGFISASITICGLILFIVPGILFWGWFAFASYILLFENIKGISALQHSKELVSGRWWSIAGRLAIFFGISIAMSIINFININLLGGILSIATGIAFPIINLLLIAITPIYMVLLYENVRATKPSTNVEGKTKTWYIIAMVIFLIAISLLIYGIAYLASHPQFIQSMIPIPHVD